MGLTELPYPDLFGWWVTTISWSIAFLVIVSLYLYRKRSDKTSEAGRTGLARVSGDFVFVWVLLGLLAFYVVSVNQGSILLFAAGNIVVEVVLAVYVLRSRPRDAH